MEKIRFTREVKQQWINALRSGDFKQTDGKLVRHGSRDEPVSYCCLGVLADLNGVLDGNGMCTLNRDEAVLRGAVEGLMSDTLHNLMVMNDHRGHDFTNIADYIERNIPAIDEGAP